MTSNFDLNNAEYFACVFFVNDKAKYSILAFIFDNPTSSFHLTNFSCDDVFKFLSVIYPLSAMFLFQVSLSMQKISYVGSIFFSFAMNECLSKQQGFCKNKGKGI